MTSYSIIDNKREKSGEVTIKISIPQDFVARCLERALKTFQEETELPGFRKGKAPTHMVRQAVGEYRLLAEAADLAIKEVYPQVIAQEKLILLAEPEAEITKLAPSNPLEVLLRVFTEPDFSLPKYKDIGQEVIRATPLAAVTKQETDETIKHILTMRSTKDAEGKEVVPELTLDFVKSLGEFESVEQFTERIHNNLAEERKRNHEREIRELITEKLLASTKISLPQRLLDHEYEDLQQHRERDLKESNTTFEDYLTRIQKTKEELEQHDRKYIEERFKMRLILSRIAKDEKLTPNEEESDRNVELLLKQYPNADPATTRSYVDSVLLHEKVYQVIEGELTEQKA